MNERSVVEVRHQEDIDYDLGSCMQYTPKCTADATADVLVEYEDDDDGVVTHTELCDEHWRAYVKEIDEAAVFGDE